MIQIKDIYKSYSGKEVVKGVSLDIKKGKITSFIGPNGAGKSTLLSMVARLLDKDSGEVMIEGKKLEDWDKKELSKTIAILKQSNNISLKLTIRELVSFGRFPYSEGNLTEEDNKYVDEAIAYMKLTDIQDKYLDELSGGQRQRAYIAMVSAQNTEYVFLDEPLNNLDMTHSGEMMKVLRGLCDDLGKTVILVMHDINYTSHYSDYIAALKNGELVQYGPTEKIIEEGVLNSIYDIDFQIAEVGGKKVSIYF